MMNYLSLKLRAKHVIVRPFLPLLLTLDRLITKRFCQFLILESCALIAAVIWLIFAEWNAWDSFLYFMALELAVPLLALQLVARLLPKWGESITFKYLAIFGAVMLGFSAMSGRAMVSEIFHIAPGEFTSALMAATFLSMSGWMAMIGGIAGILLEIGALFAAIRTRHHYRSTKSASLALQLFTLGLVSITTLLIVSSLNTNLSQAIQKIIVARIAWDIDLLPASISCIPEGADGPTENWRIFPRPVGESETLLIRGINSLPEKPFWRFTKEERERFSNFDVQEVDCGIKVAPVDKLKSVEKHLRDTSHLWGIKPIARIEAK